MTASISIQKDINRRDTGPITDRPGLLSRTKEGAKVLKEAQD